MRAMGMGRSVLLRARVFTVVAVAAGSWFSCAAHSGDGDASSHQMGDGATGLDGGGNPSDAATANDGGTGGDGAAGQDSAVSEDAAGQTDAGGQSDAALQPDAATGNPLDPDLEVADPGGTVCVTPGSMSECPGIEVCRFYDSVSGRCESCSPCGNLGASCSASNQCDILFMCYLGQCTNFCQLGTMMCGPVVNCIDIGHPTHGVCLP